MLLLSSLDSRYRCRLSVVVFCVLSLLAAASFLVDASVGFRVSSSLSLSASCCSTWVSYRWRRLAVVVVVGFSLLAVFCRCFRRQLHSVL